jgi:hypothetical protein
MSHKIRSGSKKIFGSVVRFIKRKYFLLMQFKDEEFSVTLSQK